MAENFLSGTARFQAGRLGGIGLGIVATGVDAGATLLLRGISVQSELTTKNLTRTSATLFAVNAGMGSIVKTFGFGALAIGGASLAVAQFDKNLAKVSGILLKEKSEVFEKVGKSAIQLSKEFGTSATQLSGASVTLGQAGFKLNEIQSSLRGLTEFTLATGGNINDNVDLLVRTLRGFNLEATDSVRVLNTLSFALLQAPAGADDLLDAFKQLTPIASQLGVSLESTAAAIATVSKVGLVGGVGGTSFATGLSNIINPSREALDQFGENISAFKNALQSTGDIALAFDSFLRTFGSSALEFQQNTIPGLRSQFGQNFELASDADLMNIAGQFEIINALIQIFDIRSAKAWLSYSANAGQARADTVAMELQLVKTSDVAERAIKNVVDQFARIRSVIVAGILDSDFAEVLTRELEELANSKELEEIGSIIGDEFTEILQVISDNKEVFVEFTRAAIPALNSFTQAVLVSTEAISGILKVINALPDGVTRAAFSFLILNKLFGSNLRSSILLIKNLSEQAAIRSTGIKLIEAERLATQHNIMTKAYEARVRAIENAIAKEAVTSLHGQLAIKRRILNEESILEARRISLLRAKNKIDLSIIANHNLEIAQIRTAVGVKGAEKLVDAGIIAQKNVEIKQIGLGIAQRNIEIEGRLHNIRAIGGESAALLANAKARGVSQARSTGVLPPLILPNISKQGGRAAASAAAGAAARRGAVGGGLRLAGLVLAPEIAIPLLIISMIPLLASFKSKSSGAADGLANIAASAAAATAGLTSAVSPLRQVEEQFAALIKSSTDISGDTSEVFAIDVRSKTQKQFDEIKILAKEQGKEVISINEAISRGILSGQEQELKDFLRAQQLNKTRTRRAAEEEGDIRVTEIRKSNSKSKAAVEEFFFDVLNGLKKFGVKFALTLAEVFIGIGGFIFAAVGALLLGMEKLVDDGLALLDKIPGVNTGRIAGTSSDNFFDLADKTFQFGSDLNSDENVNRMINQMGGYTKVVGEGIGAQADLNGAVEENYIVTTKIKTSQEIFNDTLGHLIENLDSFGKIGERLDDVSFDLIDGVEVATSAFYELQATGFHLTDTLGQFDEFFRVKNMLTILDEIKSVFTGIGQPVPGGFSGAIETFNAELFDIAKKIASSFDPTTFDANTFLDILAKAMDSPRFEQNNNIIVRVSSASGTEDAVALGEQIAKQLGRRGVGSRGG